MSELGDKIRRVSMAFSRGDNRFAVLALAEKVEDAIAAAERRGAERERAAVVAWLRGRGPTAWMLADAIDRGEHRREGEEHSGFCQHHLTGECAPGCRFPVPTAKEGG